MADGTDPCSLAMGDAERPGGPRNVAVLLLDSLNRHMLGSYGGTEFERAVEAPGEQFERLGIA